MNDKVLRTLEYNKIIDILTEYASSTSGKELCRELKPSDNLEDINLNQNETKDALGRMIRNGSVSFSGIHNVNPHLKRLSIGGVLSGAELLQIASLSETANRVKSFLRREDMQETESYLDPYYEQLEPLTFLSNEIRRCIISPEEISDEASPTLRQIRRSIGNIDDRIHSQLTSMVNGSLRTYLQDAVITMRNNRFCIPVKAEYKGQVPGMIHDQSSSGSTFFIEPMAIVKLNNDLKELLVKEEEEIQVILSKLSNDTAPYSESIEINYHTLTKLDFIFAKAQFAKEYKCSFPDFNTDGIIEIKDGRHPLLDPKKAVPITIKLGDSYSMLIITGPNTGGKTVSLKTLGLLTLMGQAGLPIPAFDHSKLAIFKEVYADIGDEQSIEQSLSTFSSHMTSIVSILEHADKDSLCLFDELGAGTDPTEGAALAVSILSYLHKQEIRTMATTHYSELKVYALSTPFVENACCEFDVETLRPTYRLLIGIPGKSNAFAISSKLGLPSYIIEDAKSHISEQKESFEDLLTDLEHKRNAMETEQEKIRQYKQEIEQLKKSLDKKQEQIEARKETIIREANEKARQLLNEAKEVADSTIKNFQKYSSSMPSAKEMEQERQKVREKINDVNKNLVYKPTARKQIKAKELKIGDMVKVLSMNLKGTVSSLPNQKGDLYVQMGILRSQVNIKDLELVEEESFQANPVHKSNSSKIKMAKSAAVSTEINLIGKMTDEAVALLDKYLDDAYLAHIPSVRVVHGKGTGALRAAVHKHLKRVKYVKSFRLGEFGEGDAGVTIVEFK